ncbi:MAG: serine/threonine protein phosphatase [Rhodothermales bacterium]|nr:serine/threonine protein phosphatase [Rhodothermales bacterium]
MGLIAIGDVHGCRRSLQALLKALNLRSEDHLVFIGDYVDRGPDSHGVIQDLLALRTQQECTFLRGNHESLLLSYVDRGEFETFIHNGGQQTLASYGMDVGNLYFPEDHMAFIRETKLYLDTEDLDLDTEEAFFVHAGLRPGLSVQENKERGDEMIFLWERSHIRCSNDELAWEKTVICGHTPVARPINLPKLINVDTGCVFGPRRPEFGRLTAVRWPEREFVSVNYAE